MLSRHSPSFVSNPMDEMSRFVTGVPDIVKGECRTPMLHNNMNFYRIMVYALSIEDPILVGILKT